MAAFTGPDAEALRRAISKERQPHKITALKNKFITGSVKNGHGQADAQKYFDMISHFAEYGFLRGHALALINNICLPAAYLKFNYPDAFSLPSWSRGLVFIAGAANKKSTKPNGSVSTIKAHNIDITRILSYNSTALSQNVLVGGKLFHLFCIFVFGRLGQ